MEIERKFLLSALPDLPLVTHDAVTQAYLSVSPEVRVRRAETLEGPEKGRVSCKLTVKGEGDFSREEIETPITEEFYLEIVRFIGREPIRKDYRRYMYGGRALDCSVVDAGTEHEFMYGEAEFESEDEARAFVWPGEGARDVTFERGFKMKNYWIKTRLGE